MFGLFPGLGDDEKPAVNLLEQILWWMCTQTRVSRVESWWWSCWVTGWGWSAQAEMLGCEAQVRLSPAGHLACLQWFLGCARGGGGLPLAQGRQLSGSQVENLSQQVCALAPGMMGVPVLLGASQVALVVRTCLPVQET